MPNPYGTGIGSLYGISCSTIWIYVLYSKIIFKNWSHHLAIRSFSNSTFSQDRGETLVATQLLPFFKNISDCRSMITYITNKNWSKSNGISPLLITKRCIRIWTCGDEYFMWSRLKDGQLSCCSANELNILSR